MASAIDRGNLLLQQNRPVDAEREFRRHLADEPNDGFVQALLAISLREQGRLKEATEEARRGIERAPDVPLTHFAMASVLCARNHYREALDAVDRAIELDSNDEDSHSARAAILIGMGKWSDALKSAQNALAIDPDNANARNLMAVAQTQLGRKQQARKTIQETLSHNPEDAMSHATHGWVMLHESRPTDAITCFREALRLDPTCEYAQQGLVDAIKARDPAYRVMLMYFLWMSRQKVPIQVAVIIGMLVGKNSLLGLAKAAPSVAPFILPLAGLLVAFMAMTWIAIPLSNLALCLHPEGRYALSKDQRIGAILIGAGLGVGLLGLVLGLFVRGEFVLASLIVALMLIPLGPMMKCDSGWPRITSALMAATLGVLGAVTCVRIVYDSFAAATYGPMLSAYLLGIVLCSVVNFFLVRVTVRR